MRPENLHVSHAVLSPVDIWKSKDEFLEYEKNSQEVWATLSDENREVILAVVDSALDRLKASLNDWVPASLKIENGNFIDVQFRILFSELEEQIRAKEEQTNQLIREAAQETKRMLHELETPNEKGNPK